MAITKVRFRGSAFGGAAETNRNPARAAADVIDRKRSCAIRGFAAPHCRAPRKRLPFYEGWRRHAEGVPRWHDAWSVSHDRSYQRSIRTHVCAGDRKKDGSILQAGLAVRSTTFGGATGAGGLHAE